MTTMRMSPFHGIAGAVRWGSRLFVACGLHGIKVFEIGGEHVRLIACLDDFPAFDIALRGNILAIAAGERGVVLVDARSLQPLKVWKTPFPVHALQWKENDLTGLSGCNPSTAVRFTAVPTRPIPALTG
ncbi:hypothetical protein HRbin17_00083 [bacterium HR17]|jgi:hypothetical protein|uniref:Uncharacterized protein n=1 Tax=Candidatus Fervidibacter japonicus TaxID=2035412 RepID=A0A2H5X8U4_9BACT|nr:hypothetical protein HRbin17_00083 [bacterium HR17]